MYTIPTNLAPQMAPAHNGAYQKFLLGVVLINVIEM